MKRIYILLFGIFVILVVLPRFAYAYEFVWSNRPEDRSIKYLGQIFGSVGTALQGEANTIIAQLFKIFNIAVLSLGSIVVSYTIILSTINTAQEGEVMGRRWSSVWIPLRAAIGMGMLLPTVSGYSLIQVLMMQIVVYGVAAANQVWAVTVAAIGTGSGAFGRTEVLGDRAGPARNLLKAMVCGAAINNDPNCQISFGGKQAVAYTYKTGNQAVLMVGIPDSSLYADICGGLGSGGGSASFVDPAVWLSHNAAVMLAAANAMGSTPENIVLGTPSNAAGAVRTAANTIANGLSTTPLLTPVDVQSTDALKNGWLFAGSFYFELVKVRGSARLDFSSGGFNIEYTSEAPKFNFPIEVAPRIPNSVALACKSAISKHMNTASDAVPAGTGQALAVESTLTSNTQLVLQRSGVDSHAASLYALIANAVQRATIDVLYELTKGSRRLDGTYSEVGDVGFVDPVSAMRNFGSSIMVTCENLWFAIIAAAFGILIAGCIMSGSTPICWALGAIITVLTPVLTLIIGLLWGVGASIGIYLPMVPYLVFTFTALGWMILVIETIAAAPIVALGLVSPAQENLGKASHSVLLITNVFLRPSLMVIGFVLSVKLVTAAITMVNYGFFATVYASAGNIGIFGSIALIALYGGLCISIIHECFSLVYVLPDKITRWIGQAEQSSGGIKQQLDDAKGAVDKGADIGAGLMKSSAGSAGKVAKQSMGGGGIEDLASG